MAKVSLEAFTPEQIESMAATYQAILVNPETREIVLRATKKVNPNLSLPELELKDSYRADIKTRDDKITSLEDGIRQRDAEQRVRDERAGLKELGYSTADVAAIEKLMVDEKIPLYATAVKFYEASRKVAEPTPHNATSGALSYSLPQEPLAAMKAGKKGIKAWALGAAAAAVDDIKSGRVKVAA